VIDVGSQEVYDGVMSTTAWMRDLEADRQNIAALSRLWGLIVGTEFYKRLI
jgi:hypothetical protein